jgi:hypothetical protein
VAQLRHAADRFADEGVAAVVVGMGTPEETADVARSLDLPFPVLLDPARRGYDAYGLIEGGANAFLTPKSAGAVARAMLSGSRGGRPIGNTRQLGGAFLIDREGIVRWAAPSRYAGDHASPDDILAAAKAVLRGNGRGSGF